MRSSIAAMLILLLGALPLGAQLTPAQRAEREAKANLDGGSKRFAERFDRGTEEGDPRWSLTGVVGYRERFGWGWGSSGMAPVIGRYRTGPNTHQLAVTRRGVPPARLAESATQRFSGLAEQQGRVTLSSPVGAPGTPLLIRMEITGADGSASWSRTEAVMGDEIGRYTILTPGLARGAYSMRIEVYEAGAAETPYSTSSDPLTIE